MSGRANAERWAGGWERGRRGPGELLSGHNGALRRWRTREALRRTLLRRPDLLGDAPLDAEAAAILGERRAATEHR